MNLERILLRGFCTLALLALLCNFGSANSIRILISETDALSERLTLIRSASQSIDLAYFQIRDDDTGGQILATLIDAARRGVQVRILVDGHAGSNSLPKHLMRYLIEHGVLLRERPVDVRYKLELGRSRLHDKLFIVDNRTMVIGGRNLGQDFFGMGRRLYVDLDFSISGNVVLNAATYFDSRWNECVSAEPTLTGPEAKKILKKQVHEHWNQLCYEEAYCEIDRWLNQLRVAPNKAHDRFCGKVDSSEEQNVNCMEFLHDSVGQRKDAQQAISTRILATLMQARHSILLSSPYLVMSNDLQRILADASRRGVRISILTNSLESTDQVIAHAAYVNQRRSLVRIGANVFEFQGKRTLHAKLIIVDGQTTIIGSHNLDMLSEKRNSETGLLIRDQQFADEVQRLFESFVRYSEKTEHGDLFRREARTSDADKDKLREFQRMRFVAPFIKRYL